MDCTQTHTHTPNASLLRIPFFAASILGTMGPYEAFGQPISKNRPSTNFEVLILCNLSMKCSKRFFPFFCFGDFFAQPGKKAIPNVKSELTLFSRDWHNAFDSMTWLAPFSQPIDDSSRKQWLCRGFKPKGSASWPQLVLGRVCKDSGKKRLTLAKSASSS